MTSSRWSARAALVVPLAVVGGALTLLPGGAPVAVAEGLEPWQDCDALVAHHRRELTARGLGDFAYGGFATLESTEMAAAAAAPAPAAARTAQDSAGSDESLAAVGSGPTGTNVQERGVDEPDVVKVVGDLVLVGSRGRLQVLRAGDEPELLGSVPLGDGAPAELLVDGDRVLALVSGWRPAPGEPLPPPVPMPEPLPEPEPLPVDPEPRPVDPVEPLPVDPVDPAVPLPDGPLPVEPDGGPATGPDEPSTTVVAPRAMLSIAAPGNGYVAAVLVDVADPTSPTVLETLELDGRYVSARLVDGAVRLVTASSPVLPFISPAAPYGPEQEQAAREQSEQAVDDLTADQVLPAAVRRDADGREIASGPAVDCADVQHASTSPQGGSTLLVTTLRPAQGLQALDTDAVTTDGDLVYASLDRLYVATSRWGTGAPVADAASGEPTTELHAFDTSAPDSTRYVGTGSVRGFVYGRWALSAHEGHLRVATTLTPPWDGGGQQSSSSIAVLAERADGLEEVGRVDGMGLTEQIYAVRYFGDLATVVTFRQTDPLYTVDLSDPTAPRVLGELKVPGFSTYLHPVGDGRLLGIGQDADESGRTTGFQVSLFDLTDLSAPVQVDRLSLGQGWSTASEDSRAVSYDPGRGLLAIPFGDETGRTSALGIRVDGDRLVEAGRLDVGQQWLQRALLHDGRVLAITETSLVVGDAGSFTRTGAAELAG